MFVPSMKRYELEPSEAREELIRDFLTPGLCSTTVNNIVSI